MTHHLDAAARLRPPARNPRQPAHLQWSHPLSGKVRRANVEVGTECITVPLSDIPAPTAPLHMELKPMTTPKKAPPIPPCRKRPVEPCNLLIFISIVFGLLMVGSILAAATMHAAEVVIQKLLEFWSQLS